MRKETTPFESKPLKIGNLSVDPPLVLAPMAGVTDGPYRRIMADHGAAMVTTEMVSAEGLRREHPATWRIWRQDPELCIPQAVQIFGSNPDAVSEAAKLVEQSGASLVDINGGCPVKKVVRQGAGASLLKNPDQLLAIVEAARKSIAIPLTVKIRLGWDSRQIRVVELARQLESVGADAITIHARTAVQQYSGKADWSWIRRVKEEVNIPVIGNGDVASPSMADHMLRETGCDGIMIGRAGMGNPWLFSAIASRWQHCPIRGKTPDWDLFLETALDHFEAFRRDKPHCTGHLRSILIWYSRGCPDATSLRATLMERSLPEDMLHVFRSWVLKVMERGIAFMPLKVAERAKG